MTEQSKDTAVSEAYANIVGVVYGVLKLDDGQMQELEQLGDGVRDVMWALKNARKATIKDSAPKQTEDKQENEKTRIADCRACWCDDCADIETCQRHVDGVEPDTFGPSPCAGCKNGMRFKPKEEEPNCDYKLGDGQNHG